MLSLCSLPATCLTAAVQTITTSWKTSSCTFSHLTLALWHRSSVLILNLRKSNSSVLRYVVSSLEMLVAEDYLIIYMNGATPRNKMPGISWLKKCYQMIDRRLKKGQFEMKTVRKMGYVLKMRSCYYCFCADWGRTWSLWLSLIRHGSSARSWLFPDLSSGNKRAFKLESLAETENIFMIEPNLKATMAQCWHSGLKKKLGVRKHGLSHVPASPPLLLCLRHCPPMVPPMRCRHSFEAQLIFCTAAWMCCAVFCLYFWKVIRNVCGND